MRIVIIIQMKSLFQIVVIPSIRIPNRKNKKIKNIHYYCNNMFIQWSYLEGILPLLPSVIAQSIPSLIILSLHVLCIEVFKLVMLHICAKVNNGNFCTSII